MKKWTALLLLVCILLAALPASAEAEYYGNMEIVNCEEWVSLREQPRTSARRILKVPLGAVVTECMQHGKGWVYAVYDGEAGYIQDKYVQLCEGMDMYSAMLVTGCETDIAYYEEIGSVTPVGFIPENTILRNCAVMARGRVYAEFGGRSVYVDSDCLVPYTELGHYPLQITLYKNMYAGAYQGPPAALKAAYTRDYPLEGKTFTEYDYTEYTEVSADTPKVEFVLYADTPVKNVHLFSASLRDIDAATDDMVYDFVMENIQAEMPPEQPLSVIAVMYGDMPNLAVGYEDWTGAYHFAFIEISGEDGSLILREF